MTGGCSIASKGGLPVMRIETDIDPAVYRMVESEMIMFLSMHFSNLKNSEEWV